MASEIKYEDYSDKVLSKMDNIIIVWLYEAAGELQAQVKRNTRVDTGQLKGSWDYKVNTIKHEATVGSPLQNAIWNEFGTGQYALHGDGRKTPWFYEDAKGVGHWTVGKRPQRSFFNAYESCKNVIPRGLQQKIKELSKDE